MPLRYPHFPPIPHYRRMQLLRHPAPDRLSSPEFRKSTSHNKQHENQKPKRLKRKEYKNEKTQLFLKAVSKKYRRLLSIMLAIAAAMVVPVTSQADSFNGNKSIDGFSVDYSVTASTHKSNAYLSCEGTTYQNPKPLFITGSVTVRMRGSNDILYISFIEQDSVEYGERLYLTTSVTAPGEVSFTAGISIFSFLGVRWNVQYKR